MSRSFKPILALLLWTFSLSTAFAEQKLFRIDAQDASTALTEFAKQAGQQILFKSERIKGLKTNAVSGEYDPATAMALLLKDTGLQAWTREGDVLVVDRVRPEASSQTTSQQTTAAEEPLRLTQVEEPPHAAGPAVSSAAAGDKKVQEIEVIGTNIRGVYPRSSPVEIYTAEDIARTGATTTEQFIQKLPQNLGTRTQYAAQSTYVAPNRESVNGVDLRGLGVGTTLVLLNGRRIALAAQGQAVDISLIPMSAIERVEVLTDGASAIYGSDAIGGVVNFVLRQDFSGAQTRVGYGGVTSGELRQLNATQTFGGRWSSGNALLSYDHYDASALQVMDRDYAREAGPGTLIPDDTRHGALATFTQQLGSGVNLRGDFAFSSRATDSAASFLIDPNPLFRSTSTHRTRTHQYFSTLGVDSGLGERLSGSLVGTFTRNDIESRGVQFFPGLNFTNPFELDSQHKAFDVTAKIDGGLFALSGGMARFSVGGGYLEEHYEGATPVGVTNRDDIGRTTTYGFAEVFAPLVGEGQGIRGVHRLELSLAARYTRYADASEPALDKEFGDKVSPKIGVLWAVTPAFTARATFGKSFRAPSLSETNPVSTFVALQAATVGTTPSTILLANGASPDVGPESAESFTLGVDFKPAAVEGLRFGATYFNIDYQDRIAQGDPTNGAMALATPASYPEVIFRPTSAAVIEQFLRTSATLYNLTALPVNSSDPAGSAATLAALPQFWIVNNRYRNLALSRQDGIDFNVSRQMDSAWGALSFGAQVTKIFAYEQQVTGNAPVISIVDTVLLPVDLRGRLHAGLVRNAFESTVSINYADDYANPLAVGGPGRVPSWTTVDLSLGYDFGQDARGLLGGVKLSLSAQNLLDRDPPYVTVSTGGAVRYPVGFDSANANPYGRLLIFGVSKQW